MAQQKRATRMSIDDTTLQAGRLGPAIFLKKHLTLYNGVIIILTGTQIENRRKTK